MRRSVLTIIAAVATVIASFAATAQDFTPPPGVSMELYLYPDTRFRGRPVVLNKSDPNIQGAGRFMSLHITRGVWELCAERNYVGPCVLVTGSQATIGDHAVGIVTRSARLIKDTGPTMMPSPQSRPGPDIPVAPSGEVLLERPAPAAVVAPKAEEGGEPGANPSMKGQNVEFFPAPARGGFRVLACSQGGQAPRCVQATSDGFCAERGYRDSAWRGVDVIRGKPYLSDVLCKNTADKDARGFHIPFF